MRCCYGSLCLFNDKHVDGLPIKEICCCHNVLLSSRPYPWVQIANCHHLLASSVVFQSLHYARIHRKTQNKYFFWWVMCLSSSTSSPCTFYTLYVKVTVMSVPLQKFTLLSRHVGVEWHIVHCVITKYQLVHNYCWRQAYTIPLSYIWDSRLP